MADRILAADDAEPRLIVAGNLHTQTGRIRPGFPMGSRLRRARPGIRAIQIVYNGGSYYNHSSRAFSSRRHHPDATRQHGRPVLLERRDRLLLDLPWATEAVVPHRPLPLRNPDVARPSPLVGLVRLDELPIGGSSAHVDPDRVAAMLPVFDSLPPITVFDTAEGLLVADGYHRIAAARRLGREWIELELHRGTKHDALAFAVENARRERGLSAEQAREAIERWSRPG
jgi:hypothetical protein